MKWLTRSIRLWAKWLSRFLLLIIIATITYLPCILQQKQIMELPNPDEDTLAVLRVLSGLYTTAYFFGADILATITTFGWVSAFITVRRVLTLNIHSLGVIFTLQSWSNLNLHQLLLCTLRWAWVSFNKTWVVFIYTNLSLLVERNYWNKGIYWGDLGFKLSNAMGSGNTLLETNYQTYQMSYPLSILQNLSCYLDYSSMLD